MNCNTEPRQEPLLHSPSFPPLVFLSFLYCPNGEDSHKTNLRRLQLTGLFHYLKFFNTLQHLLPCVWGGGATLNFLLVLVSIKILHI